MPRVHTRRGWLGAFPFPFAILVSLGVVIAPAAARADRGALTLELGGVLNITQVAPSVGQGDSVVGTLGGAWGGVRYALSNRLELELNGFWYAGATFTQAPVSIATGSSISVGTLSQDISRWGALAGVRYIVTGHVVRLPVGIDAGFAHTSATNRGLFDNSGTSFGLALGDGSTFDAVLAPFLGVEWLATDHLSFSIIPRLEILAGHQTTLGVVLPLTIGWSWYFL